MQTHYTVSNLIDAKDVKQLCLIGSFPTESSVVNGYTLYLFCREEKVLLPIDINELTSSTLINLCPDIYNTLNNFVHFFHARFEKILISHKNADNYYAYVRLKKAGTVYDFLFPIEDAVCLAVKLNLDMYIATELLYQEGIKITKELLVSYLR